MKDQRGFFRIARIWLILISLIIIILVIIGISIFISDKNQKPKNEVENAGTMIDNYFQNETTKENLNEITKENVIEEEPTTKILPQIEVNKIAEVNSTIDGKVPCFYNPVIPQGFKAITNKEDSTIDKTAEWGVYNAYLYGLVIEDENLNQFVWIPVENMELFKTTDWKKNKATENIDSTYIEPKLDEKTEYDTMYQKVKKYGGFYVGRYEVGDITATSERTVVKNSDSIGIRKGLNVYNYVPFKQTTISNREITGAQELAAKFLAANKYSTVKTSVMYGVQWDTMLRYIVSENNNVNDSISWGNYSTSELKYTDINGNIQTKTSGEIRLLKTGASEQTKVKNIYDIAGNVYEWTIEATGNDARIVRGGSYVVAIGQLAAARYAYNYNTANNAIGFRISFYIN